MAKGNVEIGAILYEIDQTCDQPSVAVSGGGAMC